MTLWHTPQDAKSLQAYGLMSYNIRFVNNYRKIAQLLIALVKNDAFE